MLPQLPLRPRILILGQCDDGALIGQHINAWGIKFTDEMKGKELVVDLVVIVPFVIHHFRGKYILQRQPSVSKTLSDSIAVFFFCLDCTLLMYVLVHSVYTLYVWLKIDASRYKIDILDLPTTLRFSRFRRPCPSLVTFHEPSSTV